MPALSNPRWERFAQAIVYGANVSLKQAYIESGYKARDHAAEVNASRLLRIAEPLAARVRELMAEQKAKLQLKDRYTRQAIAERMVKASEIAEQERNAAAMATSEMGIAKLFGLLDGNQDQQSNDITAAKTMHDIGTRLLQSVGYALPADAAVQEAIEANNTFIQTLERISREFQGLSIEEDDD